MNPLFSNEQHFPHFKEIEYIAPHWMILPFALADNPALIALSKEIHFFIPFHGGVGEIDGANRTDKKSRV